MAYLTPLVRVSGPELNQLDAGRVNGMVEKTFFYIIDRRAIIYLKLPKTWPMDPRFFVHRDRDSTSVSQRYARGRGKLENDIIFSPAALPSGTLLAVRLLRRKIVTSDPFAIPCAVELDKMLDSLEAVPIL